MPKDELSHQWRRLPAHNSQKVQEEEMTLAEIVADIRRMFDDYAGRMNYYDAQWLQVRIEWLEDYAREHEDDLK